MKQLKHLSLIVVSCAILLLNQNCGEYSFMDANLASSHSSSILDLDLPTYKARVGDRVYVSSVLADVYLKRASDTAPPVAVPNSVSSAVKLHLSPYITNNFGLAADKPILDVIEEKVLKQTSDFNGSCNMLEQDSSCITNRGLTDERQQELALESISPVTSVREGFRISACVDISKLDAAVKNVVFNVSGAEDTAFDKSVHTDKIFELFYPAQIMADDAYGAVSDLVDQMVASGEKNIDVWRNVSLAFCKTPGWQIP